jgi:Fe-S cluster biosynthesis and repair protein YggX
MDNPHYIQYLVDIESINLRDEICNIVVKRFPKIHKKIKTLVNSELIRRNLGDVNEKMIDKMIVEYFFETNKYHVHGFIEDNELRYYPSKYNKK